MTPAWVVDQQWIPLNPPAEVLKLGELPRAPDVLLKATRAVHVLEAKRYQPTPKSTFCNIVVSDIAQIIGAPLPHVLDDGSAAGAHEMTANMMTLALRAGLYPRWKTLGVLALGQEAAAAYAAAGKAAIAIWKNPTGASGHVMWVVPPPPGHSGVYVTGAGRSCHDQCTLAQGFGPYVPQVEFFGFDDAPERMASE